MAVKTKKKTTKRKFSARHIVKRRGHVEPFDERKVYASVYEACHAAQLSTSQAEKIAAHVTASIKKWMDKKNRANSHELHQEVIHLLKKHHEDAAFMYATHRILC